MAKKYAFYTASGRPPLPSDYNPASNVWHLQGSGGLRAGGDYAALVNVPLATAQQFEMTQVHYVAISLIGGAVLALANGGNHDQLAPPQNSFGEVVFFGGQGTVGSNGIATGGGGGAAGPNGNGQDAVGLVGGLANAGVAIQWGPALRTGAFASPGNGATAPGSDGTGGIPAQNYGGGAGAGELANGGRIVVLEYDV